jgi:hypothetical protein
MNLLRSFFCALYQTGCNRANEEHNVVLDNTASPSVALIQTETSEPRPSRQVPLVWGATAAAFGMF